MKFKPKEAVIVTFSVIGKKLQNTLSDKWWLKAGMIWNVEASKEDAIPTISCGLFSIKKQCIANF